MFKTLVGSKRKAYAPSKTKKPQLAMSPAYDRHPESSHLSGQAKTSLAKGSTNALNQRMNWNKYPSETIPSNFFATQNQVDLKITQAPVHYLDRFYFEITLTNPNAVAMVLVHWAYWFTRIELLLNGANTDDQRFDDQMYLDAILTKSDAERIHLAFAEDYDYNIERVASRYANQHFDAPKDANFQIPAASSKTFRIYYRNAWLDSHPFLPAMAGEVRFRLYSGEATIQDPQSPSFALLPPTIGTLNALFYGPVFDPRVCGHLISMYKSRCSTTKINVYERQIISLTLQPNIECSDQILSTMNGEFSALGFVLRPVGTRGVGKYSDFDYSHDAQYDGHGATWKYMSNLTLNDSNGNPVGYTKTEGNFILFNIWSQVTQSNLTHEKNFFLIPFCENFDRSHRHGHNTGSMVLDGTWTVKFTPAPDPVVPVTCNFVANYNCELIVHGFRHAEMRHMPGTGGVYYQLAKV